MCIYSAISRAGAKEEKVTHLPISNIKLGPNRPGKQTSAHWSCSCGTFWQIPALFSPSCSRSLGHLCPSPSLPDSLLPLPLLPSSSAVCQFQGVPKESRSRAKRREEEERRKRKRRSRKKERREDERGRGAQKISWGATATASGLAPLHLVQRAAGQSLLHLLPSNSSTLYYI